MFDRYKTKLKIYINAVLLVCAIGVYVGVWYATEKIVLASDSLREEMLESEASEERISAISRMFLERKDDVEKVRGYVLSEDDIVPFIEGIENLARQAGVEGETDALSVGVYPGVDSKVWGAVLVVIATEGPWSATYRFLSLLEHLPYHSELVQATIEKIEDVEDSSLWRGDFTLRVLKHK